ncbi:MAG: hypothetical protein NE328_08645 [Lentisphaeraceae bacterium]|nr:hypothetical protein [Lentisphaeraceae bacterium]
MNVDGKHFRTIWINKENPKTIQIIDQRFLPHKFVIENLNSVQDMAAAIKDMHVRGAGLIGAAAGYGMYSLLWKHQKKISWWPFNKVLKFLKPLDLLQ